jgi:WD40-like Beta Propeller Repeat
MIIDKRDFQRAVERFEPPQPVFDRLVRRRERRERRSRIGAGIVALVIIAAVGAMLVRSFEADVPAHVNERPMLRADAPGIWIVDPVAEEVTFVWGPSWIDEGYRPFGNQIGAVTMSPAGDRIAFAVRRNEPGVDGLWTVSPSGGDLQQVCSDTSCGPASIGIGIWQSWSPDGRSLAFSGGPNSPRNPTDIYAVNVDGTGLRRLESMPGEEDIADWSPDGKRIVFDHEGQLVIAPVNGGSRTVLVERGVSPQWSPDGRWIAFTRRVGGSFSIWLVHPDGTDVHPIADGEQAAGWSPDGGQLAILASRTATMAPTPHVRRYVIVDVTTGGMKTIDIETPDTAMLLFQWPTRD